MKRIELSVYSDLLLDILDNLRTYKSGSTVHLSDGTIFELPEATTVVLNSNSKSYR